jgi:hypothetical protein
MNAAAEHREPVLLSREIHNRFVALPEDQKRDVALALVRCAVEATRDMMRDEAHESRVANLGSTCCPNCGYCGACT